MPHLVVAIVAAVAVTVLRRDAGVYAVSSVAAAALAQCHLAARVAALLGAIAVSTTVGLRDADAASHNRDDVELGGEAPKEQCYTALF